MCVYVVKGFKLYQLNQKGHFFYPTTENIKKKQNSYGFSERETKFSKYKHIERCEWKRGFGRSFKDAFVQHQKLTNNKKKRKQIQFTG